MVLVYDFWSFHQHQFFVSVFKQLYLSNIFRKLHLYPQGYSNYKGFSLSLFLVSVDSQSPMSDHKVKAEFTLTLKNKFSGNYAKNRSKYHFAICYSLLLQWFFKTITVLILLLYLLQLPSGLVHQHNAMVGALSSN